MSFLTGTGNPTTSGLPISGGRLSGFIQIEAVLGTANANTDYILFGDATTAGAVLRYNAADELAVRTMSGASAGNLSLGQINASTLIYLNSPSSNVTFNSGCTLKSAASTPEAATTSAIGSLYFRSDGTVGTSVYIKESGVSNTGWIPVSTQTSSDYKLSTTTGINCNTATKQALYTVPTGRVAYITKVICRDASAAITLASAACGFDAGAVDVCTTKLLTGMTDGTIHVTLPTITTGAKEGAAAAVLGIIMTIQEAAGDTITVDVFGYLV